MFNYSETKKMVPYSSELGVGTFRSDFDNLVDRLFDSFWTSPAFLQERNWRPTDIKDTKDGISIEIELPGFSKEQIQVEEENNLLKVSAKNAKKTYVRSFSYGQNVDYKKAVVKLENGVLYITLPRTEKVKANKIPIN